MVSPPTLVVPARAGVILGKNQLPMAYSVGIQAITGLKVAPDIIQSNKVGQTGANALTRFINRATFEGEIDPGAEYIIVDDMILQGGTVADLRKYVESNGGRVVGVTTLATANNSTILPISKETLEQIERKFGRDEIEQFLEEYNIAGGIEALTESEAWFFDRWRSLDALRNKVAKGGFEGRYDGGEIGGYPEDFAEDRDRIQGIRSESVSSDRSKEGGLKSYEAYSNDVPRGQLPKRIDGPDTEGLGGAQTSAPQVGPEPAGRRERGAVAPSRT